MKRYYPQKMYMIQDNASYHKDSQVWDWFFEHRKIFKMFNLPPYSPEFNAVGTFMASYQGERDAQSVFGILIRLMI